MLPEEDRQDLSSAESDAEFELLYRWGSFAMRENSRIRRAEIGHHHHVSGPYLLRYAQESAWREDARRVDNGAQVRRVAHLALHRGPSVDFSGYWQRHFKVVAV